MAEIAPPGSERSKERFHYTFQGRVMVLDNGAGFASSGAFRGYMDMNTFSVVTFDPKGILKGREGLKDIPEFQLVSNSTLGSGQPVTLYACLDDALSATLEPLSRSLAATPGPGNLGVGPVLARLPISSVRLDEINGLTPPDWVILDALNDNAAILEGGDVVLEQTLLFDVQIPLQPSHVSQTGFGAIQAWMESHGNRFLRFHNFLQTSRFPKDLHMESMRASDMRSGRALFLPVDDRLEAMPANQLIKLSFLLHTVFNLPDVAYHVLSLADPSLAKRYLVAEGYLWPVDENESEFVLTSDYCPDIWVKVLA